MKLYSLLFVCICLFCVSMARGGNVGDLLQRTFLLFADQPLTLHDAVKQGWTAYSHGCDSKLGMAYSQGGSGGPSKSNSPIIYFTTGGQIAGIGVRAFSKPPAALIPDFWRPTGSGHYDIAIAFRNSSMMCSGIVDNDHVLGDQLMINQHFPIPLDSAEAESKGWVMGNCISGMGIHHAYDLNAPGKQTWNSSSLVPILPMYNSETTKVSAILFWMNDLERLEPFGDWEGPFTSSLFCANWCSDSGCHFDDVSFFSTMHWMFTKHALNTCSKAKCVL